MNELHNYKYMYSDMFLRCLYNRYAVSVCYKINVNMQEWSKNQIMKLHCTIYM